MQSLALFLLFTACAAQLVVDDKGYSSGYFNDPMVLNGGDYYQTRGATATCPTGYQFITDEEACLSLVSEIAGKVKGERYTNTNINPMPQYCTTRSPDINDINYYYNPQGLSTDVATALLCINSSKVCDVTDGTGTSSSYPCVCGADTCATNEICNAAVDGGVCEIYQGYYETERTVASCPSSYQTILDDGACRELAEKISDKTWGHVYSYGTVPYGCSSWTTDLVNYYVNKPAAGAALAQDIDVSLICIRKNMTCDVIDGTNFSSSYPCVCGTDTCQTGEYCDQSRNICEVIPGYYETERLDSSCPMGYQAIYDALACETVAGMISSKQYAPKFWGHSYNNPMVPHGCGTRLEDIVNYYISPTGNPNTDVKNSLICIKDTLACSVSDGTGMSSTYPCACGTDTCSDEEICNGATGRCELTPGVYETDRMAQSCPSGYKAVSNRDQCEAVATLIRLKTWNEFPHYSGTANGCGTYQSHTINFFDSPGGGVNSNVLMALICINENMALTSIRLTTELTSAATAGATTLNLLHVTSLVPGMRVSINDGINKEAHAILTVSSTGVTIASPLMFSYALNTPVTALAFDTIPVVEAIENSTNATNASSAPPLSSTLSTDLSNETMEV